MKKLIAFLKNLFCKTQDHTENTEQTHVTPVKPDPEIETNVDDNVVIVDNIDTIIDECDCDDSCECCNCNEETSDEDDTCNGCECECCDCPLDEDNYTCEEECDCNEGECCNCDEESCDEDNCTCEEECVCATVVCNKEELIIDELVVWGISNDTLGYNAIMAMIEIKDVVTYDEITTKLSETLGKTKASISTSLKALVSKANFEASLFTAIKEINKEDNFKAIIEVIYLWVSKIL